MIDRDYYDDDSYESRLIAALNEDSVKAFEQIYHLYSKRLMAFCMKYAKSREVSEEIVEDAFVWIWRNRHRLDRSSALKSLLFLRVKHYLINAYRSTLNSPVYEDYLDYASSYSREDAADMLEYDDFVRMLNAALDRLPDTQRRIVRLSKIEQLSNKEIAIRTGYSEQTVKNQLSLGLKALRKMIPQAAIEWLLIFLLY